MGRVDYEYDVLGRLVAETRYFSELNGSYTLQYGYDLAGELTSITNPWGVVVGYSRDQAGQVVAEVRNWGYGWSWSRGYVYWPGGELLAIQAGGVKWVHRDPVVKR
ncbi:RHS repeat domain-containing protein [Pyrinomonas methylaliphatogenes]|uniref:RHS repeat protein n=1 Tax=Pyrinomonas methylaliphatogenes TaxID=454194 RepID=A0A0B6WYP7_9BACT|nr:RHS repeat domain-containing protein [Pyrinomonas methylaliphatogenes]CDM65424.1 RHS repeat protein [Pyrinomonas methylaliphatogenes]